MTIINLNGFNTSGTFDGSSTTSRVDSVLGSTIGALDAVIVSTCPLADGNEVSCLLKLKIDDRLSNQCILGVFRVFQNDYLRSMASFKGFPFFYFELVILVFSVC